MMARTNNKRWSYSTGERGRNRVRAYEHSSGLLMLEFRDKGKRTRFSLGHRDRDQAKREADDAAAKLAKAEEIKPEEDEPQELTLQELLDIYGEEVTPTKSDRSQGHDKRASKMFLKYFGPDRVVSTLNLRDWKRFIKDRGEGRIGPGDPPWPGVGNRTIETDLRFLMAVFNWGTDGMLLDRNPFKGYKAPKEKNPCRVVLTDAEYQALLKVSMEIDWRFHVALVLAHETGHRIGAVRQLRWSDIDLADKEILWPADTEKTGYEHETPMTGEARRVLDLARSKNPGIGSAPVLPAPQDPTKAVGRYRMRDWWKRAEDKAGLEPKKGRGWHSLRRKFASDMKHVPLKTLQKLGGWKTHQTILQCYQDADKDEMREALGQRGIGT